MKHKFIIIFLFFASLINAQEEKTSYSFSLEEAIEHARKSNYAAINASKDIEAAKHKKWETTASGLPQINANVSYLNNLNFTEQGVTGNAFNPGGDPNDISTITFGTKHSMDAKATLSQLIFDGSYIVGLQSAKVYLQISENAKIKTDLEVTEMVTNAYGNVLLARENITILKNNKTSLEKTLFETKETFKNGLIEEENVEQLQITLSQINSSLSNATKRSEIALNFLKIALGIDINNDLVLKENLDELTSKNVVLTSSEAFEVKNSIDYRMGENNEKSKQLLLKLERYRGLPTIGAQLNYGYNSFANQFDFFNQDQKWYSNSNLGVSINMPIFSSFRDHSRKQQAKIALEQSQNELKDTEQRLKLQYQQASSDYEFSIEQYATSKSNLQLAERIEKKQQVKFKEGLSSSFEYTEAQRQLYSTQQGLLQSMIDVINKKTALDKITTKQ